jgi:hypothetical protein
MRIVSDFHDYYDAVQATGQDQTVVYLRKRKEVELNCSSFPFPVFGSISTHFDYGGQGIPKVQFVVGFCGKVYPILRFSLQRQSDPSPTIALCYSLAEVDAFIEQHFRQRQIGAYQSKDHRRHTWSMGQLRERFDESYHNTGMVGS